MVTVIARDTATHYVPQKPRAAPAYPKHILYFIASFIALVSLCHFLSMFYSFITRKRVYHWKKRTTMSFTRLPAAVADSFRILAFRWTIPIGSSQELNLVEVGLSLSYIAILFTWTFVNTTTFTGFNVNPRYYANRAGTMTASQLPIMVALGMKNNLISWLTGVNFTKLNYLHRISARVLCVLVWIHAGGHIIIGLENSLTNIVIQCGILAASAFTLLFFLSLRPIRERNYEGFLWIHFIFASIFVLGVNFHLRGHHNLAYYDVCLTMILWGLDGFIRLVRFAALNFGYLNPWSSQNSKKKLDAEVEVLSPRFIRVSFRRSRHFHWRPGQIAYLAFPSISTLPFESHPFTISTIDTDDYSESDDSTLVFILRVQRGFTQKLLKEASSDTPYKVFLNGPYGSPPILMGYQTVILVAGGSGVAHTLPLFLDILRRGKLGKNACQKMLFIWVVRDTDHIQLIANNLAPALETIPSSISVSVQLYITGTVAIPIADENLKESDFDPSADIKNSKSGLYSTMLQSPCVAVYQGRPDLRPLISKEIDEATGRMAITVCGTRSLANDTRAAIRSPRPMDILRGGPTISFHAEAFGL